MSDEIVKVLKIETGDSEQTVKGLKQEISDLKDNILNLEKGTEDYDKAVGKLQADQRKLDEVMSLTKKNATALDGSYDALTQKMSLLKKEWRSTNDEAKRNELGKQINAINDELKALDSTTGNFQRNVGDYTNSMSTALKDYRQEVKDLKAQLLGLDEGTEEYNQTIEKLGAKMHQMNDIMENAKYTTSDYGEQISNIIGIGGNLVAGFSAIQSIMVLTGDESENLEKIMVKLQASIALVQGLDGIDGFGKRLHGLKVALKTSTAGLNGFKKALIGTGIGAIVVLVGTLAANWEEFTGWIEKSIGSLDHFRAVFAGIAGSISDFFSNTFKALGSALKGDFKKAGELMKEAVSFKSNYEEAAARKSVEISQDAAREKAKISQSETEDYIKDQEAKKGADWKWSKEGIASYRRMYDEKLKMYKKDSEEYKNAQREKWAFDRELAEKRKAPDVSKLADDIANDITIEDEPIDIGNEKIDLGPSSNGAKEDAGIRIKVKERQLRKDMNDLILLDAEEAHKREVEMMKTFNQEKLAILKQAYGEESDPVKKAQIAQEIADLEIDIKKKENQELARLNREQVEDEKKSEEEKKEILMASLDTVGNALGGIADLYEASAEARLKSGKITEEQYKKEMKKVQGIQIAQATVSTIKGAIDAYMSLSGIPFVGPALGAIAAATVTAAGIAQITKMKSVSPDGNGDSSLGGGMGSVQPDSGLMTRNFDTQVTRNLTGRNEVEELNRSQRVYILESDIQESNRRVEIRESESSF